MTYSGPGKRRAGTTPYHPATRRGLTLPRASAALGALGLLGMALGWTYEARPQRERSAV